MPGIWSRRWGSTAICWRSQACSRLPSRTTETNCVWWPRPAAAWSRSWSRSIPTHPRRRAQASSGPTPSAIALASAAGPEPMREPGNAQSCPADPAEPGRRACAWPNVGAEPALGLLPALPISNLAAELLANRNLLSALAGPAIALTVDTDGGAQPVRLTGEDLTRVLVNLVKNAAEAMPGGRAHPHRSERARQPPRMRRRAWLSPSKTTGRAFPRTLWKRSSHPGYTTPGRRRARRSRRTAAGRSATADWASPSPAPSSKAPADASRPPTARTGGACFEIELPVRKTG